MSDRRQKKQMIRKEIISLIAILLFFIPACKDSDKSETNKVFGPLEVKYYIATPGEFSELFITNAEVLPSELVDITSEVAAKVVSVHFEEGQPIQKGSILVQLDAREAIARLQSLEAQLEQAEKSYERTASLLNSGGASAEEYETAKSRYLQLKAEVMAARVLVEKHSIRAPFSGVAGIRRFSPGSFVSNQQSLLNFWQLNPLILELDLPERLSGLVRTGDSISVFSDYIIDTLTAVVYAVEPVIDRRLRSNKIRAKINKRNTGLIPGTYVKAAINVRSIENVIKVPADCIIPQLGRHVVYIADDGTAKTSIVEMGRRDAVFVEILTGVNPGDTVVASGLLQIRPGTPIKPSNPLTI